MEIINSVTLRLLPRLSRINCARALTFSVSFLLHSSSLQPCHKSPQCISCILMSNYIIPPTRSQALVMCACCNLPLIPPPCRPKYPVLYNALLSPYTETSATMFCFPRTLLKHYQGDLRLTPPQMHLRLLIFNHSTTCLTSHSVVASHTLPSLSDVRMLKSSSSSTLNLGPIQIPCPLQL